MNDEYSRDGQSFEDSAWFIATLAAVAVVASLVLIASVWFGMLDGAAK